MRGISMPFHRLQEKRVFEIQDFNLICSQDNKWKQKQQEVNSSNNSSSGFVTCGNNNNSEPTSVLHMRRSQSPPTSASTLSSSFNNNNNNNTATATPTADNPATLPQEPVATNERKDEWVAELQPIPLAERCNLGLEDWDTMLSDSGQEQSILRWISGDVDETSSFGLKQLLQSSGGGNNNAHHNNPLVDFDTNAAGLGIVDQAPNFDPNPGFASSGVVSNLGPVSGSGFVATNNGNGNKMGSSAGTVNHKVNSNGNMQNAIFGSVANTNNSNSMSISAVSSLPLGGINYQQQNQNFVETPEEKPHIFNPQLLMNHQNPNFMLPLTSYPQNYQNLLLQPQPKRHNSGGGSLDLSHVPKQQPLFPDPTHELFLRNQQQIGFSHQPVPFHPQHQHHQNQHHALLDQLCKAAEMVGTGNFSHAQGILARLNHQLLSPVGKPLQRAAFYFTEALQLLLRDNTNNPSPTLPRAPTPFDVILKMGAYKVFSEVSPVIQFVNFTCNQALLEALDESDRIIHIYDFDIGFGAQWASFMQELPIRSCNRNGGGVSISPSLKITAFASPSTHHPIELALMHENLTQFASEIGVNFELDVINFDSLDQTSYTLPIFQPNETESVAVNFPIWSCSNQPASLPSFLRLIKQLSPKIIVSSDRGCNRTDLPFPDHILHALHSYVNLFESLDAVNLTPDAVNKIERFLIQPRIESTVLGRMQAPEKLPTWKTLFASAGFSPVSLSNFTETQAECVVQKTPVRGFHVEKRQSSLVLCWQRRELMSASAWRC